MRAAVAALALASGVWAAVGAADDFVSVAVFTEARGHVHASSIVETPSGALLVAWYENGDPAGAGPFEGQDMDKRQDVRISAARRATASGSWSRPFTLADTTDLPDNNPALGIDGAGRLWLVHATLIGVPEKAWGSALTRALVSTDYERDATPRWDAAHTIVPKPAGFTSAVARAAEAVRVGPGRTTDVAARANRMLANAADPYARHLGWMPRNHPLVLRDGSVLVPLANENFNMAAMAIALDGGARWTTSSAVPTAGVIQPSVIQLTDGTLQAYFRDSRGTGRIARSTSSDQGRTWTEAIPTELPNPSGGVEAIVLRSGAIGLVHNDHDGKERDRLTIAISRDNGQTWPVRKVIVHVAGERFDYPSVVQGRDGRIHMTFSDNLKSIRHVSFSESWITAP